MVGCGQQNQGAQTVRQGLESQKSVNTAPIASSFLKALSESPKAEQRPHQFTHHGNTLTDPWHWLRDADYPETNDAPVLDYLNAENAYFQRWLKSHQALTDTVFEEFKGRLDEKEASVPWISNGYEYRWIYREGDEYRTHLRRPVGADENDEVVYLDEPALAKNHEYFVLGDHAISRDNRLLAYSVDTSGDERYEIRIKDLVTNELLNDVITNSGGDLAFAEDGSLIYEALEETKWRVNSINRHLIGTDPKSDRALVTENDDTYHLFFGETSDKRFLAFGVNKGSISEYRVLAQDTLDEEPILLASRDLQFEYRLDHAHGKFWILANDEHVNFRLASVDSTAPTYENWSTVI